MIKEHLISAWDSIKSIFYLIIQKIHTREMPETLQGEVISVAHYLTVKIGKILELKGISRLIDRTRLIDKSRSFIKRKKFLVDGVQYSFSKV